MQKLKKTFLVIMSIKDKKETKIAHLHLLLMNMFIFETSIAFLINKHTILTIIHKEQYFRIKNEYDHVFYLEQKQRSKEQNETK